WATSRYVNQTTDGGLSWIERVDIPAFLSKEIYFIDSIGFIIEPLKLYKTTDFGNSWITKLNTQYIIRGFGWITSSRGFIMGDGVYETNDSGNSWQEILELRNIGLRKFHAPLNYLGYSVGNQGLIYKYIDSSYIPVELISFTGFFDNEKIILNWETVSEINNSGFEILKSKDRENWQSIGFVGGSGSSTENNSYSFLDNSKLYEKNYYRLKQIDYDGSYEYSNVIEVSVPLNNFKLYQNYPNPFNPITTIKFAVPQKTFINVSLYDIKGEKINDLVNEEKERGIYSIEFNSKNLSSGVYLYRMTSFDGYNSSKKLIILK
ncbi:MAG: T9SS type A sorting domain-containing protein, partial [Ignavibacteria bacterium]|nr:T9SS type A sorting domain-containing protein [Ignavibacteria bacterium]